MNSFSICFRCCLTSFGGFRWGYSFRLTNGRVRYWNSFQLGLISIWRKSTSQQPFPVQVSPDIGSLEPRIFFFRTTSPRLRSYRNRMSISIHFFYFNGLRNRLSSEVNPMKPEQGQSENKLKWGCIMRRCPNTYIRIIIWSVRHKSGACKWLRENIWWAQELCDWQYEGMSRFSWSADARQTATASATVDSSTSQVLDGWGRPTRLLREVASDREGVLTIVLRRI